MVTVFVPPVMFQSAPRALARGDHDGGDTAKWRLKVSIRAPRTRAGRLLFHVRFTVRCCFNPRPAHSRGATGRGDRDAGEQTGFNPRPAHSRGATGFDYPELRNVVLFQSAPRALARGDVSF